MDNADNKKDTWILDIDFSQLMDLRIDFAFKLLFTKGDARLLISLLNAIFANKKINRLIQKLTVLNPYLEKESGGDKLSILDIRAELDDGTAILIEMHLSYDLAQLKSKMIRSWARAYGEVLDVGAKYNQPPTIAIAFTNGPVKPLRINKKTKADTNKIHRLCMIMDCEDFDVFSDAMEMHFIDMQAFAKAINSAGNINIKNAEEMFVKWLAIITQKEIENKEIITNICKEEGDLQMAVSTLARQGEDKIIRQAYQRRQDEIFFNNMNIIRAEDAERRAEQAEAEIKRLQSVDSENEKLRQELAMLKAKGSNS